MYEVDFLPIDGESGNSTKSGDAIAIRFTTQADKKQAIIVIDGGYGAIGDNLVDHIQKYFATTSVDLVISTHPDQDHIGGLAKVIEQLDVGELMLHMPWNHVPDVSDFSNIEAVIELAKVALKRGTTISEPFAGVERFGGQLVVLGPDEQYYKAQIEKHLEEAREGFKESQSVGALVRDLLRKMLRKTLDYLPIETLDDEIYSSPRNDSSVVALVTVDNDRLLFTGDAGIEALGRSADFYEARFGDFSQVSLGFFQAPHHGSRRNVGPTILDRIIGQKGVPHSIACSAFISAAKEATKHPSPKVVNALKRRGCRVCATQGKAISFASGAPTRPGWGPATELPVMDEDDD